MAKFGPGINGPDYDQGRLGQFTRSVVDLSWAFLASEKDLYAARAIDLLRIWFLDEATKMNPHLTYSKYTPGQPAPYPTGVISTHVWVEMVQCVGFLAASPSWSADIETGLRNWFAEYLDWLRSSEQGLEEKHFKNNRGVWYDAQLIAFARFAGNDALARQIIEVSAKSRLAQQLAADGSLPEELQRTNGLTYSYMTLRAFALLALMSELLGISYWQETGRDERGLRLALDYLRPYIQDPAAWPFQQIKEPSFKKAIFPYAAAAEAYADDELAALLKQVAGDLWEAEPARALFVLH